LAFLYISKPLVKDIIANIVLTAMKRDNYNGLTIQVKGFAPIGMLEFWNSGIMGSGLRLVDLTARRG